MKNKKKTIRKRFGDKTYTWTINEDKKQVSCYVLQEAPEIGKAIGKIFEDYNFPNTHLGYKLRGIILHDDFCFRGIGVTKCYEEDVFDEKTGVEISRLKAERDLHNEIMQEMDNIIRSLDSYKKELFRLKDNLKLKYKKLNQTK